MAGHSRFAPSAEERNQTCAASFLLSEKEEDVQTTDAAHGTAAHHVGELCLRLDHDVDVYAGCTVAVTPKGACRFVHDQAPIEDEEKGFEVDDEMIVAVQEYVDRCRVLPGEHFTEVRVEHTDWCPDFDEHGKPLDPQYGTSDHIACIAGGKNPDYPESTIVVTDLKYGLGVKVFAEGNKQAVKYALGAWKEYNWLYGFKRVVIRIAQPRLDHFDVWELSVEELLEWGAEAKRLLTRVFEPNPPMVASEKGCKFCKVAARCASTPGWALYEERKAYVAMQFDDLTGEPTAKFDAIPEKDLMKAYAATALYDIAGKAVAKEVFRRAAKGEPVGRLKVVAKYTDRTWRDEEAAKSFMRTHGIDDSKTVTKKFVSPAGAEKVLPKALWPKLAELYDRPPGGPVLVDKTDPRQPYRDTIVAEAFDDITE